MTNFVSNIFLKFQNIFQYSSMHWQRLTDCTPHLCINETLTPVTAEPERPGKGEIIFSRRESNNFMIWVQRSVAIITRIYRQKFTSIFKSYKNVSQTKWNFKRAHFSHFMATKTEYNITIEMLLPSNLLQNVLLQKSA